MPTATPFPATAWQDSLLPASFRGVPFGVTEEQGTAGRRGKLHEYPFRDTPYAEDLGRRARRYRITGFVLGDDAGPQRDALIQACEQKGAGPLIHPTLGMVSVQVDPEVPIEWTERWNEGRVIEIHLAFVEPGELLYPSSAADTQAQTQTSAADAYAATKGDYVAASDSITAAGGT